MSGALQRFQIVNYLGCSVSFLLNCHASTVHHRMSSLTGRLMLAVGPLGSVQICGMKSASELLETWQSCHTSQQEAPLALDLSGSCYTSLHFGHNPGRAAPLHCSPAVAGMSLPSLW